MFGFFFIAARSIFQSDLKMTRNSNLKVGLSTSLGLKKSLCGRERLFLSQQAELELGEWMVVHAF